MPDTLVLNIRALRGDIAGIEEVFRLRGQDTFNRNSPWLHRAKTELALARGWLGKLLGALGEANPYPESTNPESRTIEPHAYTATKFDDEPTAAGFGVIGAVAMLKWLRKKIDAVADFHNREIVRGLYDRPPFTHREAMTTAVYLHLANAKMMLGEELGTYRDGRRAV